MCAVSVSVTVTRSASRRHAGELHTGELSAAWRRPADRFALAWRRAPRAGRFCALVCVKRHPHLVPVPLVQRARELETETRDKIVDFFYLYNISCLTCATCAICVMPHPHSRRAQRSAGGREGVAAQERRAIALAQHRQLAERGKTRIESLAKRSTHTRRRRRRNTKQDGHPTPDRNRVKLG